MRGFQGGNYVDHLQFEALAREKLMTGQTGLHCNGQAKSRFAYAGFQPSLTVSQRAAKVNGKPISTYSSEIGRTYVKAGLRLEREQMEFAWQAKPTWSGNVRCFKTDYRFDRWMMVGSSNTVEAVNSPLPTKKYDHSVTLWFPHTDFND
jgi:hypothetical protein